MTVYADILFLINFSMDFLSLCLTGRLTSHRLSRRRLMLAAAFGSLAGCAAMLLLPEKGSVPFVLAGLLTALAVVRIAFGKARSLRQLGRDALILWGTGTLLGGILTSVLSLGNAVRVWEDGGRNSFVPAVLLCFTAASAFLRFAGHSGGRHSAEVTVKAVGTSVSFGALCDSGCLLTEPISGMPVILASEAALGALGRMLTSEEPLLRLRMIPAEGVCGRRLLRGFVPEEVTVNGRAVSAVVACVPDGGNYGGYDGIVPAKLVR